MTNGVRGRGPRLSGGTARGATPSRPGARFCAVTHCGTRTSRHSARFCGKRVPRLPKAPDVLSVSSDSALRTSLRPGRAPHDPVLDARASHRTAGCGHCLGELRRPVREREVQVARGSHIQTNRARRESSRHLHLFTNGPSRSPRQALRQHNLVTPGRSGRRSCVFLRHSDPCLGPEIVNLFVILKHRHINKNSAMTRTAASAGQ